MQCPTGVSVASDWFEMTPREYVEHLVPQLEQLFTPAAAEIARADLDATRAALRIEDL